MKRGPALGSVPDPVRMPPRPCPSTQYATLRTTARARKVLGCQLIATATPIPADRAAKTIAISRPWPAAALATLCCRPASHAVPEGAALIALDVALALLLAASSHD